MTAAITEPRGASTSRAASTSARRIDSPARTAAASAVARSRSWSSAAASLASRRRPSHPSTAIGPPTAPIARPTGPTRFPPNVPPATAAASHAAAYPAGWPGHSRRDAREPRRSKPRQRRGSPPSAPRRSRIRSSRRVATASDASQPLTAIEAPTMAAAITDHLRPGLALARSVPTGAGSSAGNHSPAPTGTRPAARTDRPRARPPS
jgi:hypothetical protein